MAQAKTVVARSRSARIRKAMLLPKPKGTPKPSYSVSLKAAVQLLHRAIDDGDLIDHHSGQYLLLPITGELFDELASFGLRGRRSGA